MDIKALLELLATDKISSTGILVVVCVILFYLIKDKKQYLDQTEKILKQGNSTLDEIKNVTLELKRSNDISEMNNKFRDEKLNRIENTLLSVADTIKYGRRVSDYKD